MCSDPVRKHCTTPTASEESVLGEFMQG